MTQGGFMNTISSLDIKVAIVGGIAMDLVFHIDEWPEQGESIQAHVNSGFDQVPGGKGLNQAVASARLGTHASLISSIGNDSHYNEKLLAVLDANKVDRQRVIPRDKSGTDISAVLNQFGEPGFIGCRRASEDLSEDEITSSHLQISEADIIQVTFDISVKAIQAILRVAKRQHKPIILNASPASNIPIEIVNDIDFVVLSSQEARRWYEMLRNRDHVDKMSIDDIGKDILLHGAKTVIITNVIQGCNIFKPHEDSHRPMRHRYPPLEVAPQNSTRATDAFCSALAINYIQQSRNASNAKRLILFASAAGALACMGSGGIDDLPKREELMTYLERLPAKTDEQFEIRAYVDSHQGGIHGE
jgi:ribokinase